MGTVIARHTTCLVGSRRFRAVAISGAPALPLSERGSLWFPDVLELLNLRSLKHEAIDVALKTAIIFAVTFSTATH
jgi:hypothetical protein